MMEPLKSFRKVGVKERRHAKDLRQQITFFPFLFTTTGNSIEDAGVTSLSESLKSNTTLTELDLSCTYKKRHTQMASIYNPLFSFLITSTDNKIGNTGATSLSEALKSNTTITELYLSGEYKRKKTSK